MNAVNFSSLYTIDTLVHCLFTHYYLFEMATIEIETTEKMKLRQTDQLPDVPGGQNGGGSDMDSLLEEALYLAGRTSQAGQSGHSLPMKNCRTDLTKRETQILQSILAGQTNKQIARALCRSRRTIEYHRHRLMLKLNAHSAADLVRCALASGLRWNN